MAQVKKTFERLLQIKQRQWDQRWGVDYIAATRADAREAPGISTGSILRPLKLQEREFHTLSEAEKFVSLLALYHPQCWDVHEQFVLFPNSREHPLQNHPMAGGVRLPIFMGTLNVTQRLGNNSHPRVRLKIGNDPREWPMAPFPFTGDLRLFMKDNDGVYCLNWTIKRKYIDFRHRGPRSKPRALNDLDDPASMFRHEMEEVYHADAGIRTQRVSLDKIDLNMRFNLRNLFLDDTRSIQISNCARDDALDLIREYIGQDVPMYVVANMITKKFSIEMVDAVGLIHQGIWRRELRVDLFRPVLTTKPLRPEIVDVIDKYSDWFRR